MTETKFSSEDELWELVKFFSERGDELEKKLQAAHEAHYLEGSGWLRLYQTLQAQLVALKAEISRLQSERSERQQ